MKHRNNFVGLVCLLFVIVIAGCDAENDTFYFVNHSSYNLSISPSHGQMWSGFSLEAGYEQKIKQDFIVYFSYAPANNVWCDDWSRPGWIYFYDFQKQP
jgi:hypothetical protein